MISVTFSSVEAQPKSTISGWVWPLGGDGYVYETRKSTKNNTFLENTDYQIRNLDLVNKGATIGDDHINCIGVGLHRQWHAGVDFYRKGESTEGAIVQAIGDGTVYYAQDLNYPGAVVIIEHTLPQGGQVYSVYAHLDPTSLQVSTGSTVETGQQLGLVVFNEHSGRFPELHPDGDDSHLHFEIRTFGDGSSIFPGPSDCNFPPNTFVPGIGYTYPTLPDSFGYLDPIEYLESRVAGPTLTRRSYLPVIHNNPPQCIEGQDLITSARNSGFEYPVTDPRPWFEITTYFDPPDNRYYNFVQDDSFLAHSGNHYAFLGDQLPMGGWIVDEEMPQSFRLPDNIDWLEWVQYLWLEQTNGSPLDYGTEFGDQFILSLKDAETGQSLVGDIIIDHTSQDFPNFVWLEVKIPINNAGALSNRLVSTSYSSLTDGDTTLSTMRVDDVGFITHCGN